MSLRGRVRDGDPEAFRELFDQYARAVYNHAFRLVGDWAVAQDVVSLTFLEAWRLRARVEAGDEDAERSLRPWLLGIATNVARNARRAARRHDLALARLPVPDAVPDLADEVSARLDGEARLAVVMHALDALKQHEREVLTLCVWSGLDYAQAAEALGVPIGTVRSRLSRARGKLAKLLADEVLRPPEKTGEPPLESGQVMGDRDHAVRLAQENAR